MDDRLRQLVASGASISAIGRELGLTRYAVKSALERLGLQTERARRLAEGRAAVSGVVIRSCPRHGSTTFARDTNGTFRCTRCSSEAVSRRRRKIKVTLIQEAGGRCLVCGYDRCVGALGFHHLDPASKAFGLAEGGVARSLAKCREEVAKCVLLCANCHAEVEAGLVALPPLKHRPQRPIPSLGCLPHSPVAQSVERTAVNR